MNKINIILLITGVFLFYPLFLNWVLSVEGVENSYKTKHSRNFITLSRGDTFYKILGTGETIVFIHGFSSASFIWSNNIDYFIQKGFRVLIYDLYGRGFSDKPDQDNTIDYFTGQLDELLTRLGIEEPVHLVGLSMGGLIAAGFTDTYPGKVKSLSLIAPVSGNLVSGGGKLLKIPILGEYLILAYGEGILKNAYKNNFTRPTSYKKLKKEFNLYLHHKGFKRSLLSSYRHILQEDFNVHYQRLGECSLPKLLLWGREDKVVPFKNHSKVMENMRPDLFVPLEDAGHTMNYEKSETVNLILYDFIHSGKRN